MFKSIESKMDYLINSSGTTREWRVREELDSYFTLYSKTNSRGGKKLEHKRDKVTLKIQKIMGDEKC